MKKVLLLNNISDIAVNIFKDEKYEVDIYNQLTPNELKQIIGILERKTICHLIQI